MIFKSAFEKFSAENSTKLQASVSNLQEVVGGIAAMGAVTAEKIDLIARNSVLQVGWLRQIHRVLVKGSATPKEKAEAAKPTKSEPAGASILGGTEKKSKGLFKGIKEAAMALVLIAGALVIFIGAMALAGVLISPAMIPAILAVTISIALVTLAFTQMIKVMAENNVKGKDVLMAALAVAIMAPVVVLTALVFLMLPDKYKAPDPMWTLLAGLSILIFSLSVVLILKGAGETLAKNKSLVFLLPLLIMGLALSILATAYIFQSLPDEYKTPPIGWVIGSGLSLLAFGLVAALLGFVVKAAGGPVNFLMGALALIVLALVITAVANIFQLLPDSLFKKGGLLYDIADTMEYFGFKMVNVFIYLVKELMPYVKEFITFMANLFVDIFPKIVDPLNRFIDALAVSFGKLLDHVVPLITAAFNGIATVLTASVDIIVPIITAIKDVILGVLDFIIKGFQEFRGFINDLVSIGAENITSIGLSLFSLAGGLAAVMAVMAGGAIAQGVGKAVEGLGNMIGGIASGIGNLFSGEKASNEPKMDPMQFISFVAANIGALEKAATALEKISTSLSQIMMLKPTEGLMKFLGIFSNYVKIISGGGIFGGPADAIVKANSSFVSLFKEMQKVDSMKLMKVNDILESTANLMKLDKGDTIEDTMEAVVEFIEKAVQVIADNSATVKEVSKGTEVSQSELKQMIEQMKLAVEKMGSQNVAADIKSALNGATLGVRVTNVSEFPRR